MPSKPSPSWKWYPWMAFYALSKALLWNCFMSLVAHSVLCHQAGDFWLVRQPLVGSITIAIQKPLWIYSSYHGALLPPDASNYHACNSCFPSLHCISFSFLQNAQPIALFRANWALPWPLTRIWTGILKQKFREWLNGSCLMPKTWSRLLRLQSILFLQLQHGSLLGGFQVKQS